MISIICHKPQVATQGFGFIIIVDKFASNCGPIVDGDVNLSSCQHLSVLHSEVLCAEQADISPAKGSFDVFVMGGFLAALCGGGPRFFTSKLFNDHVVWFTMLVWVTATWQALVGCWSRSVTQLIRWTPPAVSANGLRLRTMHRSAV